jgi:LAO/AO transport system kinase
LTNSGIKELWEIILEYIAFTKSSGYFENFRKEQAIIRMHNTIIEYLNCSFYNHAEVKLLLPEIERQLHEGKITSYKAAIKLLDKYFKRQTE